MRFLISLYRGKNDPSVCNLKISCYFAMIFTQINETTRLPFQCFLPSFSKYTYKTFLDIWY